MPHISALRENKFLKQVEFLKIFCFAIFSMIFSLIASPAAFSAENINSLTLQGDETLTRGDYEQAFSIASKIIDKDPRNLNGYRLALICCVAAGKEIAFNKIVEIAKKYGLSTIDEMAAKILYAGNQIHSAEISISGYETKWREKYGKSL